MLKLLPLFLAIAYGLVMLRFSLWRTRAILDRQSRPLDDPGLLALTARLAEAQGVDRLPVHIFEIAGVNGLAAPDGRIFLTRGFIDRYRAGAVSAEELAGVIAHELGHVALGHARRRMIDMTGQNAVFVMLTALLSRFVPFIGPWIAHVIATAFAAGLSRKAEHEADAYASALLVKAGIGTGPQKSLFAKLEGLVGGGAGGVPEWLRSHPRAAERIRLIEEREARWGLA
jgi:putative metalloprotease